jgi:hypothetical protein
VTFSLQILASVERGSKYRLAKNGAKKEGRCHLAVSAFITNWFFTAVVRIKHLSPDAAWLFIFGRNIQKLVQIIILHSI